MWWIPVAIVLGAAIYAGVVLFWIGFTHRRYAAYHRAEGIEPEAPPGGGWVMFYLRTVAGAFRVGWWNVRALGRDGLRLPAGASNGSTVVCVHGFHMNGSCTWGIRRYLEARGRPTRALFLGPPYRRPEVYARALRRVLLETAPASPDGRLDVVAHSMGGLVLRHALADEPSLASRVGRIVTLGTPHRGTAVLRRFRSGPVYRMMGRESAYVRDLPDFERSAPRSVVTTIAASHDLVVYPAGVAHLPGSRAVELPGVGHLGLLTEDRTMRAIGGALGLDDTER